MFVIYFCFRINKKLYIIKIYTIENNKNNKKLYTIKVTMFKIFKYNVYVYYIYR